MQSGNRRKRKEHDKHSKPEQNGKVKDSMSAEQRDRIRAYTDVLLKLKDECIRNYRERNLKAEVRVDDKRLMDYIFKEIPMRTFIDMLDRTSGRPDIEFKGNVFRIRRAYQIENKEQLRQHLLQSRYGLVEDQNFEMCYRGIRQDIESLIQEGWVRVIETFEGVRKNEQNKLRVFFPRDISEKKVEDQVEWTQSELPTVCQEYISQEYRKLCQTDNNSTWEQVFEQKPELLCDQEREILSNIHKANSRRDKKGDENSKEKPRTRKRLKWQNNHLDIDFSQHF